MLYLWMSLFGVAVVALDQLTKYLTVSHILLGHDAPAIQGLFHFTYVHNYGAAFSSFAGARWFFVALFLVFLGLVIWEFSKKSMPFTGMLFYSFYQSTIA